MLSRCARLLSLMPLLLSGCGAAVAEDWGSKEFALERADLVDGGWVIVDRPTRGPLEMHFGDRSGFSESCYLAGALAGRTLRDWTARTAADYFEFVREDAKQHRNIEWGKAFSMTLGDSIGSCQIDAAERGGAVYLTLTATKNCYWTYCVRSARTLEATEQDLGRLAALMRWAAWMPDVAETPDQPPPVKRSDVPGLDTEGATRVPFPR